MYFVYEHWRTDTNLPFYVGKGNSDRVLSIKRNDDHKKICEALKNSGHFVEIKILLETKDENEALNVEKLNIAACRAAGIELCNKTAGGQGISGYRHSEELKKRYSLEKKGDPMLQCKTPEALHKMARTLSLRMSGKIVPQFQTNSAKIKSAAAHSKNMRGIAPPQLNTKEARRKQAEAQSKNKKGKPVDWLRSPTAILNLSRATAKRLKGKIPLQMGTPEAILKMKKTKSNQMKGKSVPHLHTKEAVKNREYVKHRNRYPYWGA